MQVLMPARKRWGTGVKGGRADGRTGGRADGRTEDLLNGNLVQGFVQVSRLPCLVGPGNSSLLLEPGFSSVFG